MSLMLRLTVKCRYVECRYSECHYAECRNAVFLYHCTLERSLLISTMLQIWGLSL
jgi:hypothetical protein